MYLDYGCAYIYQALVAENFGTLIAKHVEALLYSPPAVIEHFESPMIGIIFNDAAAARALFDIFRRWSSSGGATDGLWMTIDVSNGEDYYVEFGPAMDLLLKRVAPGKLSQFLDIRLMATHHVKAFDATTPHLPAFRRIWDGSPVTVQAFVSAPDGPIPVETAQLREVALRILDSSEARTPRRVREDLIQGAPPPRDHSPAAVFARRQGALHRYYPVTQERLPHHETFADIASALHAAGFQNWQTEQAACTLTLPDRFRRGLGGHEAMRTRSQAEVLMQLEAEPERLAQAVPRYTLVQIRNQIVSDALALSRFIDPTSRVRPSEVQNWLDRRGYLTSASPEDRSDEKTHA